jgi:CHAT domain-containing protein
MKVKFNYFYKSIPRWMYNFFLIMVITMFVITGINTVFASNPTIENILVKAEEYRSNGFYILAKEQLEEARKILLCKPDSLTKAEVLRKLGNMLRLVGDIGKIDEVFFEECKGENSANLTEKVNSIQVLTQSLKIAQNLKDNHAIYWALFNLGNTTRVIAEKYQSVNDIELAKIATQKTLDYYHQAVNTSLDPNLNIRIKLNQLSFLINTKKWLVDADENDHKSDQQLSELIDKWPEIYTNITNSLLNPSQKLSAKIDLAQSLIKYHDLPQLTTKVKIDWQDITQILEKTLEEAKIINHGKIKSYTLGYLANVKEKTAQYEDAIKFTKEALNLLGNKYQDHLEIQYQWQWQLGRLYEKIGERKNAIAAYNTAFNALEYLKQDLVSLNPDVQYSFKEQVEPVYKELADLLLKENNLPSAIEVIDKLQIAELNNFFRNDCISYKTKKLTEIIGKDSKTAIIYPIFFKDRIEVILYLSGQNFSHYTHNLPDDVTKMITNLSEELQSNNPYGHQDLSKELYSLIIPPEMRQKLDDYSIKKLVFILDTKLQSIPMGTLYDGQKYLIEDFEIAISPSLNLFEPQSLLTKYQRVLIGGLSHKAPSFDLPEVKNFQFKELTNVEQELDNINKNTSKKISFIELLKNRKFTQKNIQLAMNNNPTIIHFATHGKFSADPEKTFIVTENELLDINKLKSLIKSSETKAKPIELLVLSACETAKGDQRATLGLAGIAVRSGARSTVASLWKINDPFTAEFMDKFYHQLIIENKSKSESLQIVQKGFLKGDNEKYKKPYYWGAFVLIGNWF